MKAIDWKVAGVLFALPAALAVATAAAEEPDFRALRDLDVHVEKLMQGWCVPGVAVGVVTTDEPTPRYARGFGLRDIAKDLPVTPATVFGIGSCAKAFTASAMALLVDDGVLDWNTPLHEVVPGFRLHDERATAAATPRDLLLHRTGIGDYTMLRNMLPDGRDGLWTWISGLEPVDEFRNSFRYSNLSYLVAAKAVEDQADEPFEALITRRILQPAGMDATTLSYSESRKTGQLAEPYLNFGVDHPFGDGPIRSREFDGMTRSREQVAAPSGGVYSSLEDMLVWARLNLDGGRANGRRILSDEVVRAMHADQARIWTEPEGDEQTFLSYGFGWYVQDYRGHLTVQHAGQVYGYMSLVYLLPEEGLGIVVLTNAYYHHLAYNLAKDIVDRLYGHPRIDRSGDLDGFRQYALNLFEQTAGFWDTRPADATPPSRTLAEYAGIYTNPRYGSLSVDVVQGALRVTFPADVTLELRHFEADAFAAETELLDYIHLMHRFQIGSAGIVEEIRIPLDEWKEDVRFKRIRQP